MSIMFVFTSGNLFVITEVVGEYILYIFDVFEWDTDIGLTFLLCFNIVYIGR